jgi:hypothetical protein
MSKSSKPRTNSVANLVRICASAGTELSPPAQIPLSDDDLPFWKSILGEFAVADWSPHKLHMAALLARTMGMLERSQRQQREEGTLVPRADGTLRVNPRLGHTERLLKQVLAIRRSLALTGRALAGGSQKAAHQRAANRETERRFLDGDDDDGLLPS